MHEYPAEPVKYEKPKASFYLSHDQHPVAKEHMPGDEGKMVVHYKVKSHRQEDDGKGETQYEINKVEHADKNDKKNASTMRMDDLKKHIQDKTEEVEKGTELDKDMQGHSESGIKDEGKDE